MYTCITYYTYHIISPLNNNPPNNKNKNLGGTNMVHYQFRRRHDYPPHKKKHDIWFDLPPFIITPLIKQKAWGEKICVTSN